VRLYEVLFNNESPESLGDDWLGDINKASLQVLQGAYITPELAGAKVGACCRTAGRAPLWGVLGSGLWQGCALPLAAALRRSPVHLAHAARALLPPAKGL
jgi:hypothetical protein